MQCGTPTQEESSLFFWRCRPLDALPSPGKVLDAHDNRSAESKVGGSCKKQPLHLHLCDTFCILLSRFQRQQRAERGVQPGHRLTDLFQNVNPPAATDMPATTIPTSEVPVVDFGLFTHGTPEQRIQTARDILTAFKQVGFVYLQNHELPEEELEQAFYHVRHVAGFNHELMRGFLR